MLQPQQEPSSGETTHFFYSWMERNEASLFHALVLTVRMLKIICSLNRICSQQMRISCTIGFEIGVVK